MLEQATCTAQSLRAPKRRSNLVLTGDCFGTLRLAMTNGDAPRNDRMGTRLAMTEESLLDDFRGVFHRDAALQGLGDGAAALEHSDRALSFPALALGDLNGVFGAAM